MSCVFCDRDGWTSADLYLENEYCVYASTRDPRDPPDVLPGCGVIVPIAHRATPFEFTSEEWAATHDLLMRAKAALDERWAPDAYTLGWNCSVPGAGDTGHAHLHVLPRFDDEPCSAGVRTGIKDPKNRRPDPWAKGNGRAVG